MYKLAEITAGLLLFKKILKGKNPVYRKPSAAAKITTPIPSTKSEIANGK